MQAAASRSNPAAATPTGSEIRDAAAAALSASVVSTAAAQGSYVTETERPH